MHRERERERLENRARKPEPEPQPQPEPSSFGQQAETSAATHLTPEVVQLAPTARLTVEGERGVGGFSGQPGPPKAMAPF